MQTPCPLSSGDRAGARTWASHFSQAGCLEEVGLPPTWPRTADQAGGGTLVLSPGSTFYEGLQRVGGNKAMPEPQAFAPAKLAHAPPSWDLRTVLMGGQ